MPLIGFQGLCFSFFFSGDWSLPYNGGDWVVFQVFSLGFLIDFCMVGDEGFGFLSKEV